MDAQHHAPTNDAANNPDNILHNDTDTVTLPESVSSADVLAMAVQAAVKAAPVCVLARIQAKLDAQASHGNAPAFTARVLDYTGRGLHRLDTRSLGTRFALRDAAAQFLALCDRAALQGQGSPVDDAAAALCVAVNLLARVDQHPVRNAAMIPMAHEALAKAQASFGRVAA